MLQSGVRVLTEGKVYKQLIQLALPIMATFLFALMLRKNILTALKINLCCTGLCILSVKPLPALINHLLKGINKPPTVESVAYCMMNLQGDGHQLQIYDLFSD